MELFTRHMLKQKKMKKNPKNIAPKLWIVSDEWRTQNAETQILEYILQDSTILKHLITDYVAILFIIVSVTLHHIKSLCFLF